MNKLETPDDVDDFYDAVDAIEEKVFLVLKKSKSAKDGRAACLALLRAASITHQIQLNHAELAHFLALAASVYCESEELLQSEEDV